MNAPPLSPLEDSLLTAALEERLGDGAVERPRERRPRQALAAALLLGGIACVGAVAVLATRRADVVAQDPQPTPPPPSEHALAAAAFWPLHPGTRWQYRQTVATAETDLTVEVTAKATTRHGETVQLTERAGDDLAVSFWHVDANGIFALPHAGVADDPLFDPIGEPACWLRSPIGVETRWQHQWLPSTALRRGVGRRQRPTTDDLIPVDCELLGVAEHVVVPCGTYSCVHLRTLGDTAAGRREEHVWLARDLGPVRTTLRLGDAPERVRELTAFALAPPELPLPRALAADLGTQEPVRWLDLPADEDTAWTIRSRFALVGSGDERRWYRVRHNHVEPFAPAQLADWQRLTADEGHGERQEGLFPQRQAIGLCRLAARMHGLAHDLTVGGHVGFTVTIGAGSARVELELPFTDRAGARTTRKYDVTTRAGQPVTFVGLD